MNGASVSPIPYPDANRILVFFSLPNCPYCVQFRPEFQKTKTQLATLAAQTGLKFAEVDLEKLTPVQRQELQAPLSAPTVYLANLRSGQLLNVLQWRPMAGERNADGLIEFVRYYTSINPSEVRLF